MKAQRAKILHRYLDNFWNIVIGLSCVNDKDVGIHASDLGSVCCLAEGERWVIDLSA